MKLCCRQLTVVWLHAGKSAQQLLRIQGGEQMAIANSAPARLPLPMFLIPGTVRGCRLRTLDPCTMRSASNVGSSKADISLSRL